MSAALRAAITAPYSLTLQWLPRRKDIHAATYPYEMAGLERASGTSCDYVLLA
eukprot:CAMPEP_0115865430 /NCGR_PEP_ID=MMETSP0287-20121206/19717_1 /TAXON_ID=412157 /ORGANISM="Chrysochromulina rotalis, Strain UIO044" /LENGTH=52 /DNA_ID=CAMNT_0003319941 /DNA_START=399 /DNA_END=555 /DNA_ORIENTATION=+